MNRPLDVLQNWTIEITDVKSYNGTKPIFNPGDTLVFNSSSTKLIDASGNATRTIVCEAAGDRKAREIQLDILPTTRPAGVNPPRDNAITIPDVTQFDGLPRDCYLHIAVCYDDVILWRDHCEEESSIVFTVEESVGIDAAEVKRQINDLREQIKALEDQLASPSARSSSTVVTPKATTPTPVAAAPVATNNNPAPVEDTGLVKSLLKTIRGIFNQ